MLLRSIRTGSRREDEPCPLVLLLRLLPLLLLVVLLPVDPEDLPPAFFAARSLGLMLLVHSVPSRSFVALDDLRADSLRPLPLPSLSLLLLLADGFADDNLALAPPLLPPKVAIPRLCGAAASGSSSGSGAAVASAEKRSLLRLSPPPPSNHRRILRNCASMRMRNLGSTADATTVPSNAMTTRWPSRKSGSMVGISLEGLRSRSHRTSLEGLRSRASRRARVEEAFVRFPSKSRACSNANESPAHARLSLYFDHGLRSFVRSLYGRHTLART